MAEDVIVLLEYLGWTGKRDLHVVGISLGGMIALGNLPHSSINIPIPDPLDNRAGHSDTRPNRVFDVNSDNCWSL
jgi:hypothetical protein